MGEVDPAFVQAFDQRPKLKPTILVEDEIPIIDLSVLSNCHGDTKQLVSEIGLACQKWGFFQVINHGVSLELCEKMEEVGKRFFELPLEEKKKVKRDMVNALGYHDGEHTKNVRDWKEVFDFLVEDMTMLPASNDPDDKEMRVLTNQWPQYPLEFREVCQEYAREVNKLAHKLLGLIALSLGQPENKFSDFFKDLQTSLIRFNHYPPCPFPHLALGVGRHKDAGALTVLAQDDVGGLEVRRKSDGEWIPVTPTRNAFIINVGDMVQVWSNDKYESVEHRVVVNTDKARFSIPFFFFPVYHMMVKPLEELLNDDNPAKYREYNWGKFFAARNRSDFKKLDVENIQIDHFREACQEYAREVEKLALKLMGLIALSLGLPEDRFKGYFIDQTTRIRLNHYPPCPSPELALGVGRHKDGGALTVLAQDDVGGLEVKRKTDGEWVKVKPTPNAYIINLGDTLQVWSNESTEHRVMVNSNKERFSIPYFLEPSHYTIIKPLEELISEQDPAKYRPYSWGKFMTHRKLSNFKKLNVENIQIHHFRI